MIQDIHPHRLDNTFVATEIQENDYVFHFKGNALLLKNDGDTVEIPRMKALAGCGSDGLFLFTLNDVRCFLVWDCPVPDNEAYAFHEIKFPHIIPRKEIDWASGVALQLKNWYAQHRFCGKCGARTTHKNDERAIVCTGCQTIKYPVISPAIIVAIRRDDKILLARNANFPDGYFSLVAGYVDVGESIEDAIAREAQEEVGIAIKNVRYYNSQPWPFSGSMMLGFIAEADDDQEIQIDDKEIVEAGWYTRNNLPNYPSDRSIAGEIIEKYKNGEL